MCLAHRRRRKGRRRVRRLYAISRSTLGSGRQSRVRLDVRRAHGRAARVLWRVRVVLLVVCAIRIGCAGPTAYDPVRIASRGGRGRTAPRDGAAGRGRAWTVIRAGRAAGCAGYNEKTMVVLPRLRLA